MSDRSNSSIVAFGLEIGNEVTRTLDLQPPPTRYHFTLLCLVQSRTPPPPPGKIFGRSINTNTGADGKIRPGKKGDHGDDADNAPGSFLPGDEADIRVKWQEKVFGPEDVITLSSGQRRGGKSQQQRAVSPPDNALSRLEVRGGG